MCAKAAATLAVGVAVATAWRRLPSGVAHRLAEVSPGSGARFAACPRSVPRRPAGPGGTLPPVFEPGESVACAIVGAGFAGASTAYHLASRGVADVVILEREATWGAHASGRNAALGRQLCEDARVTELAVRGARFLRSPPADFCREPLWRPTGSLLWCEAEALAAELEERAAASDLRCARRGAAGVLERWPELAGGAGGVALHVESDGVIDVHALLGAYLGAARRAGVRLELGCDVTSIRGDDRGAVIETSKGPLLAKSVVNAAGAWVDEVARSAAARPGGFTPVQRHLFVTEPVSAPAMDSPFVWYLGADEFYVRREGAGLLLSACDELVSAPCDAQVLPGAAENLADVMSRAAPGLAELGIARAWACLRTFAADRQPVIGWDPSESWLYWVAGLGGHGATASPAIGDEAAADLFRRLRG